MVAVSVVVGVTVGVIAAVVVAAAAVLIARVNCHQETPYQGRRYQGRRYQETRHQETPNTQKRTNLPIYPIKKKRKGIFLIINNLNFSNPDEQRHGTQKDAEALDKLFTDIGFDVQIKHDLTAKAIRETCKRMANVQDSCYSCFGAAILSHGGNGGVYGTDRNFVRTEDIMNYFTETNCPHLKGKPKMFFLQACQNGNLGESSSPHQGCFIDSDPYNRGKTVAKIELKTHFFLAVATPLGYFAYRSARDGSFFIRGIVDVFRQNAADLHLDDLMTLVKQTVASKGVQVPVTKSSLLKQLFLNPDKDLMASQGLHAHDE